MDPRYARARMTHVRLVIAHGLWILGAAVVLAAFSYYQWLAQEHQVPVCQMLRIARGWRVSLAGGILKVASGFLLMEGSRWWERGLWLMV
jgi:hypothetical protein